MALVIVTTVTGNISVMTSLRRARRTPTHYPLASLAAADLLVGTCVLPLAAARELFIFQLDRTLCACWSTLDVLCCTASILSLCALGYERWSGITAPLARAQRARRAKIFACLVWPVALAVALPAAFVPSPVNYHEGEPVKACTVNTNAGYVFFSVTFSFYLPTSVMLVMYARILTSLASRPPIRAHRGRSPRIDAAEQANNGEGINRAASRCATPAQGDKFKHSQKTTTFLSPKGGHLHIPGASTQPNRAPSVSKTVCGSPGGITARQRRATRTIVMLMSLYLVCWTPFFIMLPVDSLCDCVRDTTWRWCTWLGYANSALDPLVYASASSGVRRALHASITWTSSLRATVTGAGAAAA